MSKSSGQLGVPTLYHFITIDYSHINILAFNIIYTPPPLQVQLFPADVQGRLGRPFRLMPKVRRM